MSASSPQRWSELLRLYRDKRLLVIFLLGVSSGFPWVMLGSAMSAWLKDAGLTRTAIGFFGSLFIVYAVNFLWAPFVDRLRIPWLTARFGQRRAWILLMQLFILIGCIGIAFSDPGEHLYWTFAIGLLIAIASATQDIAVDAYRIEVMAVDEVEKMPAGAAMATGGWYTGYQLLGAPAFYLAGEGFAWPEVYWFLAGVMAVLMFAVLGLGQEPSHPPTHLHAKATHRYRQWLERTSGQGKFSEWGGWLLATVVEPLAEFFRRNGIRLALAILGFVVLFKLGEAFLGRMSIVFYKEVGFSDTEIGTYSKLIGWWVTIVFAVLGSLLNARFGIIRGLLLGGIAMAATNLLFAWIAVIGPDTRAFAIAIVADGFTAAFSTVAFVAFISSLTSRAFTATQYALLASLGNLGRTSVASFSGMAVDSLQGNWVLFFILTALMVIPSLIILVWIGKRFERAMQPPDHLNKEHV